MKLHPLKVSFTTLLLTLTSSTLFAQEVPKASIKSNGQLVYNLAQKEVDSFKSMFSEGNFYGRLRNNNFFFHYNADDPSHNSHLVSGVGASLVYESARLDGFDMRLGIYSSHAFFDDNNDPVNRLKPAKDTLSRFDYSNTGNKSLGVVGQLNVGYSFSKTDLILGRQLIETFYTKSNDTKMVPNAFDGISLSSKDLSDTRITTAYFYQQKLRDHLEGHAVFMVGDANSSAAQNPQWSENDDSAMHRGMTYSALKAAGKPTHAPLILLDAQNQSIENLKLNVASYVVPELLTQVMGELNYTFDLGNFSIAPGLRYLQQFDNGAGAVGGPSIYLVGISGYKDAKSLNSKMLAARLVTKFDDYKINLAMTHVFDEADLVTPWRAFPTSGYTRSMGMYNWRASVTSYRLELVKGATSNGFYKTPFIQTSVLYMDGDSNKLETDSMFYYAGIVQNIPIMPELQYKLRLGYRDFIGDSAAVSDYLDSRLEFNYLF